MKYTLVISLLFAGTRLLSAQESSTRQSAATKQEETIFMRPSGYDSTKSFEEQFKPDNLALFIGLQVFLPPVIHPAAGPILFSREGNILEKAGNYYTITDILKGEPIEQLKQKKVVNICGTRYKEFDTPLWKDLIIYTIYVLRENGPKDTLNNTPLYWVVAQSKQEPYSCSYVDVFMAVPYFTKQKEIYLNQPVVYLADKSKWYCKEVSLQMSKDNDSRDSVYAVFCLLTNSRDEHMQLRPPSEKHGRSFLTEQNYTWMDHANRNEKMEMIAVAKEKQEKHQSDCISRFGQRRGELVAQGNIEKGMSRDMCKTAWGNPWEIAKTGTSAGGKEIWKYNWFFTLHFENGILVKVEQ
jgi:hypothetical protein